jgi:ACT domain-containing protein
MRLIGRFTEIKWSRDKVQIPIVFYHRVALGLESRTTVYISPVRPKQEGDPINELIITTFDPKWWKNMYRLSLKMEERHGAVAEALDRIKTCGANIGILETVTTEAGKQGTHHLLVFIHVDESQVPNLKKLLLELAKGQNPENFSITALDRLKACPMDTRPQPLKLETRKKRLEIAASHFKSLIGPRSLNDEPTPTRLLLYSDTEEKFLQCYLPKRDDVLLAVWVRHQETKGALYSFTDPVSRRKANILSSYSRLVEANETAEWKAIIDVTNAECSVRELLDDIGNSQFAKELSYVTLSYIEKTGSQNLEIPGLPSPQSCDFIGRADKVDTILAGIAPGNRETVPTSFLVKGFHKAGKSALLWHLRKRLEETIYCDRAWCMVHVFHEQPQQSFWKSLYEAAKKWAEEAGIKPAHQQQREGMDLYGVRTLEEIAVQQAPHDEFAKFVSQTGKTLVVLLDEADSLLHPSKDYASEANSIVTQMKHLSEAGPEHGQHSRVSWVMADAQSWELSSRLHSSLLGRFESVFLHPLSEKEAGELTKKLLNEKRYDLWADHLHKVYSRIITACGNQPFYIERVRQQLIILINKAPVKVNIVDSSMIEKALLATATQSLKEHFQTTYDRLFALCDHKLLRNLISGKGDSGIPCRKLLKPTMWHVDLAAFPGLSCVGAHADSTVRFIELMRMWAKAVDPYPQERIKVHRPGKVIRRSRATRE